MNQWVDFDKDIAVGEDNEIEEDRLLHIAKSSLPEQVQSDDDFMVEPTPSAKEMRVRLHRPRNGLESRPFSMEVDHDFASEVDKMLREESYQ